MSKSLIIGANGLVGTALCAALSQANEEFVGTFFSRPTPGLRCLDSTNPEEVTCLLEDIRPNVIYFAPNFSGGVNRAERERDEAKSFYLSALEPICDYCDKSAAVVVLYSTDYVFGNSDHEVEEGQPPSPMNYYGELKQASEDYVRGHTTRHLILRTTNVYGYDPLTKTPNFLMQVLLKLRAGQKVELDPKQISTPTYVEDLALASVRLVNSEQYGTYHIVGDEYMSRFDWAKEVAHQLGFDQGMVVPISSTAGSIQRPTKLKLSNAKVKKAIGFNFQDINTALKKIKSQIERG